MTGDIHCINTPPIGNNVGNAPTKVSNYHGSRTRKECCTLATLTREVASAARLVFADAGKSAKLASAATNCGRIANGKDSTSVSILLAGLKAEKSALVRASASVF
jgi:hypothetical protein